MKYGKSQNLKAIRQIIYSGGDDLFIVGKWDVVLQMAHTIQKEFANWVCHNPSLTFPAAWLRWVAASLIESCSIQ